MNLGVKRIINCIYIYIYLYFQFGPCKSYWWSFCYVLSEAIWCQGQQVNQSEADTYKAVLPHKHDSE